MPPLINIPPDSSVSSQMQIMNPDVIQYHYVTRCQRSFVDQNNVTKICDVPYRVSVLLLSFVLSSGVGWR